jgi:hypothetical protein
VLIVWIEFLLVAWPLLVNQPEMPIRDVLRNAGIVTLRAPGAGLGLALMVIVLTFISTALAFLLATALAAFISVLAQHYIHIQAPALANFPLRPGEGAVPPPEEEEEQ